MLLWVNTTTKKLIDADNPDMSIKAKILLCIALMMTHASWNYSSAFLDIRKLMIAQGMLYFCAYYTITAQKTKKSWKDVYILAKQWSSSFNLTIIDRDSSVAIAVLRVTILRIDFSVKCLHFARHFSLHVIHGEIVSQRWEIIVFDISARLNMTLSSR